MATTITKPSTTSAFDECDWLGPWACEEQAASDIADVTIDNCELPLLDISERCAAIFIHGPLLASHTRYVGKLVDQAAALDEVAYIQLMIGGSYYGQVEGIEETMHKIWRARRTKLVWSYLHWCTGPAYLLAAATSHIFADTEPQMQIGGLRLARCANGVVEFPNRGKHLAELLQQYRTLSASTVLHLLKGNVFGFEFGQAHGVIDRCIAEVVMQMNKAA